MHPEQSFQCDDDWRKQSMEYMVVMTVALWRYLGLRHTLMLRCMEATWSSMYCHVMYSTPEAGRPTKRVPNRVHSVTTRSS